MVLQPSLERDYASLDELYGAVQAHAFKESYAVIMRRSKPGYTERPNERAVEGSSRESYGIEQQQRQRL